MEWLRQQNLPHRGRRGSRPAVASACITIYLGLAILSGCASGIVNRDVAPVDQGVIQDINVRLREGGITSGYVDRDDRGRVELQGEYRDEAEVDRAFSIAQTVVGVRWVSPVTPERIKVTEWARCLSVFLSGQSCGFQSATVKVPGNEIPPGAIDKKYALIVGVGNYKNGISPLQYPEKDAEDVYRYLTSAEGAKFNPTNVILLRGSGATYNAIERALQTIVQRARENDFVLLYFSSHGTPPDKYGGVHVVAYDTEVNPRERVWWTSLTEKRLREFIQQVKAKRLLVVMDACYSNGAYSQIPGFLPTGAKALGAEDEEGYGRSRRDLAQHLLGAKDLIVEEDEPPFGGATGWGKVLISASDAGEKSWESDRLQNSFFTYYFIDGLRRYRGAIKESFEYAQPLVTAGVSREKGAEQTPQLTPSRRGWDMSIASP